MFLRYRPHERRLTARSGRVHVGALRDQLFDQRAITGARGGHQRRFAGDQRRVWIGAGLQQSPDHCLAAVQASIPQWRDAKIGRRIHPGAGPNQQVGALDVVPIARPVKRRGAVRVCCVGVHVFLHESAKRFRVRGLRRVEKR